MPNSQNVMRFFQNNLQNLHLQNSHTMLAQNTTSFWKQRCNDYESYELFQEDFKNICFIWLFKSFSIFTSTILLFSFVLEVKQFAHQGPKQQHYFLTLPFLLPRRLIFCTRDHLALKSNYNFYLTYCCRL